MNFPKPDENDFNLQGFYKKNASELLSFKKQLDKMSRINWVNDMAQCLVEIYSFLSTKQLYGEFTTLDLRVIKYLLGKCPEVYFEDREEGYFLHFSDCEKYNEFGVELKKGYFKKNYFHNLNEILFFKQ